MSINRPKFSNFFSGTGLDEPLVPDDPVVRELEQEKRQYQRIICWLLILLVGTIFAVVMLAIRLNQSNQNHNQLVASTGSDPAQKSFGKISVLESASNQNSIRTATGFLGVPLDDTNRSNSSHDQIIIEGGNNTLGVMSFFPQGTIPFSTVKEACSLLYEGYSDFTIRSEYLSTGNCHITRIQVSSEECAKISQNQPSKHYFSIHGRTFVADCISEQIGCEVSETVAIVLNGTNSTTFLNNTQRRRRLALQQSCAVGTVYVEGKGSSDCISTQFTSMAAVRMSLTVTTVPYKVAIKGFASLVHAFREAVSDCYFANNPRNPSCPVLRCCPNPSCFPGNARVEMENGDVKLMRDLRVGDKVLSVNSKGEKEYSDVYMFGHKMANIQRAFVHLTSESGHKLVGTSDHFVYVCSDPTCSFHNAVLKRFGEIEVDGDYVVLKDGRVSKVVQIDVDMEEGIYNPYTLNGNIVVNDVIASCHSEWILDDWVVGWDRYLPGVYQGLFGPIRVLYRLWPGLLGRFDVEHPSGAIFASVRSVVDVFRVYFGAMSV